MIDTFGGIVTLECDICGATCDETFDDFYDAVEYKKDPENGWISRKEFKTWEDVCPNCK